MFLRLNYFKTKVKLFCYLLLLACSNNLFSQGCANYAVTRSTSITYVSIVSSGSNFAWRNTGTNYNDDNRTYFTPIGFDFWYLGTRYTNFCVSLNGYLDFSSNTADGNGTGYGAHHANQFSVGGANGTTLAVTPMYDDLWTPGQGTTAIATNLFYKTTGTAPNRVLTAEWVGFEIWKGAPYWTTPPSINFQVKIYETSGLIEFDYGTMNAGTATFAYACGINNAWPAATPTAVDLLTQQTANSTTFNFTANNTLATLPASNSRLNFTPPAPSAAPTGLSFSGVTGISMTLNWTDNATNELGYVIYNSTDGINYTFVSQQAANSVSAPVTGLLPGTNYFWRVYAVTEGNLGTALSGTQATSATGNVVSVATGPWNTPATWNCVCVPTAGDDVTIANTHVVTLDVNGACNSLVVGQGVSGQLVLGNNTTARSLAVTNDITINAGGSMITSANNAVHVMTVGGNITNSGTFNMATTANRVCNITFNKNGSQTVSGTGATTTFNRIILNEGTSASNVLEINTSNLSIVPTNFLTLTNGTFKLSTAPGAAVTAFSGATTIPATAGIWINNAGINMSTGNTITLFGALRVSSGALTVGNANNENLICQNGTVTIDGGTVNVAGRFGKVGFTSLANFNLSSGIITVGTVGSTTGSEDMFRMDETASIFNMSGGKIVIQRPGAGNLGYRNTGGTLGTVSGGTLQIGDASTPAAQTIIINSSVPVYYLAVSSGVAVAASLATNSLVVKNNVNISAGSISANAISMAVAGDWTNNGSFSAGTGSVVFNGTVAQQIGGSAATAFNNLTVANTSAGLTLAAPVSVSGALTLTSGKVFTDLTNILTLNAGSSSTSGNATTFVDGPMAKAGTTAFVFPIGAGARWARIGIGAPSASTTFRAQYFASSFANASSMATFPTPILDNVSKIEHWLLDRTVGTGDAAVTLYWEDATFSDIDDCSTADLRVAHWNSIGMWENNNNAVTTTGSCAGAVPGSVSTSAVVTSFSPFTFGSLSPGVNPLPVELLTFDAVLKAGKVDTDWATASEKNNDYFTVERSSDGIQFEPVGNVKGSGTCSEKHNYSLTDDNPFGGISYYRLKQTDFDGKDSYSLVVSLNNPDLNRSTIYPNPAHDKFILKGSELEGAQITVTNLVGQKVAVLSEKMKDAVVFDASGLTPGVYFVRISKNSETVTKKVVVK